MGDRSGWIGVIAGLTAQGAIEEEAVDGRNGDGTSIAGNQTRCVFREKTRLLRPGGEINEGRNSRNVNDGTRLRDEIQGVLHGNRSPTHGGTDPVSECVNR